MGFGVSRRRGLGLAIGGLSLAACGAGPAAGGRRMLVTSLDDDGPGSLRRAIETGAGTEIGFAVAGPIRLHRDLVIRTPGITIDGSHAPSPGITLEGASVRIRASDTTLRHLRVRPGDGPGPNPDARDGITIDGRDPVEDVLVEHCSVSWAIDEGIAVAAGDHRRITFRHNLVAEQLHHSRHSKGAHSRGMLLASGNRDIRVEQNLFAHNYARNPVVSSGTAASIVNNLIYNFGSQSIHFYQDDDPIDVVVAGNVLVYGPDSLAKAIATFAPEVARPGLRAVVVDNVVVDGGDIRPTPNWSTGLPAGATVGTRLPVDRVEAHVLARAGARPDERDLTDRRLIDEVIRREGQIRDRPAEA